MKGNIKIRTEVNEIEKIKTVDKNNKIKILFFGEINKIDKPFSKWTKKKKTQIIKIRNESEDITIDFTERTIIIRVL